MSEQNHREQAFEAWVAEHPVLTYRRTHQKIWDNGYDAALALAVELAAALENLNGRINYNKQPDDTKAAIERCDAALIAYREATSAQPVSS